MSQKLSNNIIKDDLGLTYNLNNIFAICDVSTQTNRVYCLKKYKTLKRVKHAYGQMNTNKSDSRFITKIFKIEYKLINNIIELTYESIEH